MRIGELLVQQRMIREGELARALAEKPGDKRLCSFLIARGLIDFDDASRALGEQKGVPSALAKHLAGRDAKLAELIPGELGRGSCALPIGRTSSGALIVCVRDPASSLLEALSQATSAEIIMVIAPANRLEHLVLDAYGMSPTDELDVDFSTTGVGENQLMRPPSVARAAAAAASLPPLPDMSALDPESVRLALTDLDDVRVDKDPTQSGHLQKFGTDSPRASTIDARVTRPMSLGAISVGLEHATTREAATDLALAYVATRWTTGLVLAIRDRTAVGYRGHGVSMPDLVSVPLTVPSTIQRAVETKFVSADRPESPAQAALVHALGGPVTPTAAPVVVNNQPVAVIAVGDPINRDTADLAATDLGQLAAALSSAYQRLLAR